MPTITLSVDEDVATRESPAYGAGLGDHLPIGYWSGAKYRSAIRFSKPAGWQAWTGVTKATLNVFVSDHQHVGIRNSGVYVRKQLPSNLWTKGAGTVDCETGFSSSNNTQYADLSPTTGSQLSFSSGTTANAKKSITVTAMVEWYRDSDDHIVFIFDPQGTDDYTELWSNNSPSNTYDPKLVIEYETAAPPGQPVLTSPLAGEAVVGTQPLFGWTHTATQSDPQTSAEVYLYDAGGVQIGTPLVVAGAATQALWPNILTRGTTYQFAVRTADVSGFGALSAKRTFSIKGNPTVTIASTRVMRWSNGRPRLEVSWSTDQPQGTYRVQVASPAFDSGPQNGSLQTYLLDTVDVSDNVVANVTITVTNTDTSPLTGSASRAFTPRYGLTVHRRDLGATPVTSWVGAEWTGAMPTGTDIRVQYGSAATAVAAPTAWYEDLTQAPLARYVFYRVWLIPSASAGPSFDKMVITSTQGVVIPLTLDKWSTTKGASSGLVAPWVVSDKEYVYGTRSAKADMTAAGATSSLYSQPIILKKDRSYVLTGLMKSEGNSGATFRLERADGTVLATCSDGAGNPFSLIKTTPWFDATVTVQDVIRYRAPTYKAVGAVPETVYVVLRVSGVTGSAAWFDAMKLEESTVATPWSPGAVGATIADAGGIQIDGSKGGVFRYKGVAGTARGYVEGGPAGLVLGTDTELTAPSEGVLAVEGVPVSLNTHTHGAPAFVVPTVTLITTGFGTYNPPGGCKYVVVEMVGGGGAGGAATGSGTAGNGALGGSGGGGGYCRKTIGATAVAGASYSVGAGGAASTLAVGAINMNAGAGQAGGSNGNSTADRHGGAPGPGGTATGGDVNIPGASAAGGWISPSNTRVAAAIGGASVLGFGAEALTANATGGSNGVAAPANSGGGGGGSYCLANATSRTGGAGGSGLIIITEYYQ